MKHRWVTALHWPVRSLYGRVALVVFGTLLLAHLLTFGAIVRERSELMRGMMSSYLARDVATAVAVLEAQAPPDRAAWLPKLAREHYHYTLAPAAPAAPGPSPVATPGAAAVAAGALVGPLVAELGAGRVGEPRASDDGRGLRLPLRLADGQTLWLALEPPRGWISRGTALLLAVQLALLALATGWGVWLAVRPLKRLAAAADAAHTGLTAPGPAGRALLDELGPLELQSAARAFNAMQRRIQQQLDERLHLLAAIAHDLQTPITRLRLRAEQVGEAPLRDRLLADLQAMQALVEEGLAYARTAQAAQEPLQAVDLDALLDGLVCDAVEAGHAAELVGRLGRPLITRVQALRRLVLNLLDNALKFGGPGPVQVAVDPQPGGLHIRVEDNGPGIPPGELARVMQPFERLEGSRSRDTGGTGLGLAIAQQLAQALGGRLSLHNRPQGGLEARLELPCP